MKPSLIDTDILSLFLSKNQEVISYFDSYLQAFNELNISILAYYEIISGLYYKDAKNKLQLFDEFSLCLNIIPINEKSAKKSAEIYSLLRKKGIMLADIDILIAGIAVSNTISH